MNVSKSLAVVLAASLTACSSLPTSAPTVKEFSKSLPKDDSPPKTYLAGPRYQMINLGPDIAAAVTKFYSSKSSAVLGASNYTPGLILRPGDLVSISIFDVSSQPLLGSGSAEDATTASIAPVSGHATALPAETIELNGDVKIPFAGLVNIAGLTPSEAARAIEVSLKGQLKAPQALVALVNSPLDTVTVGGDVARPGIVNLSVRGEHILDVVAAAGGAKYEAYDCDIELIRRGASVQMWLQDLIDHPDHNVAMQPGDSLYILHNPRSFTVLGSSMKVSQIDFDSQSVTLAEAIARSGGPNNSLSNIEYIYLLRYEPSALVARFGSKNRVEADDSMNNSAKAPIAYRINLRDGRSYFIAQKFQIHDKDLILMTKSDFSQLQQIFELVHSVTGVYFDLRATSITGSN
jgi:polysaccharide export outer membrane protein